MALWLARQLGLRDPNVPGGTMIGTLVWERE